MVEEHPFAPYIRILGKGPNLSRHLTKAESEAAFRMILEEKVETLQLSAFLSLLRVQTEDPEEAAGFVAAATDAIAVPGDAPAVDITWASYAGKARQLPWYLCVALLLAKEGFRVFMHGSEDHTPGRVYSSAALRALGISPADSMKDAARRLDGDRFAYLPLATMSPVLNDMILRLRPLLGLRSPIHTFARLLNPFNAPYEVQAIVHPHYRTLHRDTALVTGQTNMVVFKGEGGEVERRPNKGTRVLGVQKGTPFEEEWPPLQEDHFAEKLEVLDLDHFAAVWRGEAEDSYATLAVSGTLAVLLKLLGRAETQAEAEALGLKMWNNRR